MMDQYAVLVGKACDWCKTVPPHSRWWVEDSRFEELAFALEMNRRYAQEGSDWPRPYKIMLRTVSILRASHFEGTRRPC